MKHTTLFIFLLIVLSFSSRSQTIYYVNYGTGNNSNAGTSWATSFRDITKALAMAQSSSAAQVEIWVASGTYTPIDGITALPANSRDTSFTIYRGDGIGKSLKIYGGFAGGEASLAARNASVNVTYMEGSLGTKRAFHVGIVAGMAATADSVVIDGFTIRRGFGDSVGNKTFNGTSIDHCTGAGLVLANNLSPKLAIRNCKFVDNLITSVTSQALGGALYISNTTVTLNGCEFTNNEVGDYADLGGPACAVMGGAIYAISSGLNISACNLTGNLSKVRHYVDVASIGGGLYLKNCTNVAVANSHFEGNYCSADWSTGYLSGGAIYDFASPMQVTRCTFSFNSAADYYFTGGGGLSTVIPGGGAIFNRSATVSIDNSKFTDNRAFHNSGGYHSYGGAVYDSSSTVKYTLDTFSTNSCTGGGEGGGIYAYSSRDTIVNCNFDHNTADFGGAIGSSDVGTSLWIKNCDIGYNNGVGAAVYNGAASTLRVHNTYMYRGVGQHGAGIYSAGPDLYAVNCHFYFNQSSISGGAIRCNATPRLIDSCLFEENRAPDGGAICTGSSVSLTASHSRFAGNRATNIGGAIFFSAGTTAAVLKSDGNVFTANNADNKGGAIASMGTDTVVNNIFADNTSWGNGGALYAPGAEHFVCNNTFAHNSSLNGDGGAIASDGASCYMNIYNNIFFQSYAAAPWGANSRDTALYGTGLYYCYANIFTGTDPKMVDTLDFDGPDNIWKTADDGLAITKCSPAVNSGNNSFVSPTSLVDIRNIPRIIGGTVDKGAYEAATIGSINGAASLCVGSISPYTDTTAGGTWSSSNTAIATISNTGIVTAIAVGSVTISYGHSTTCTNDVSTKTITVVSPAAAVTGPSNVCVAANITLSNNAAGGTWTSSSAFVATVNTTSGVVRGVTAGSVTITYHVTNACGTYHISKTIIVDPLPGLATVTGADTVCLGEQIVLSSSLTGGVWSIVTGNAGVDAAGVVTGVNVGADTVKYTMTNVCGTASGKHLVVVSNTGVCDPLSSKLANRATAGFSVFPNPARNQVTIITSLELKGSATLTLTNMLGEKIREWTIKDSKTIILVSDVSPGIYLLTMPGNGRNMYQRLSIER